MENLGPSAIFLQIAEVREGLKAQQEHSSELDHRVFDLKSKIESCQESPSASDSIARIEKLEELAAKFGKKCDSANERLDVHDEKFKDVEKDSNYLHEKATNIDAKVRRLDGSSSNVDSKIKHLERRMNDKRTRLDAHGTKIRAMEGRMHEFSIKVNGCDAKVRELERRGEEIRDTVMDWVRYLNKSVHDLLKRYLPSYSRRAREGILDF